MVWEDLHWADPSTLELLGLFIDQAPTAPMLHLLTFRPEFVPLWPTRSHMTPLTLHRLERPQVEAMIARLAAGKTLPVEVIEHIVSKTDGVPLFIEELTKMLLESALLQEEADHYALTGPLAAVTIPTTLYDSLMARLDRLPTVREVAQLGAVLGREFAYELLQALMTMEEDTLQHGLTQLVDAELLYQRGRPPRARYLFKHALIQDAAYASLLKSTRQQYHQQTAQLLEARFPDIVAAEPELLAHHYTEAGSHAQAVGYWQQAGTRALQRSANVEAIAHVHRGLELLTALPDTSQRTQRELDLLTTLGPALLSTKGYAAQK
jgi:predicted ATPase